VVIVSTGKIDPLRHARLQRLCYASGTSLLRMRLSLEDVPSQRSSLQD
jgi:hypothetical protein